jgi:hypothetical protein
VPAEVTTFFSDRWINGFDVKVQDEDEDDV